MIALIGFAVLSSAHAYKILRSMKKPSQQDLTAPQSLSTVPRPGFGERTNGQDQSHLALWLNAISEFHKAQCYYSIALQVASFMALFSNGSGNRNQEDEAFLLLVAADGLAPVAITFYTLALLEQINSYHVILSLLSALLASIIGFCIVTKYPSQGVFSGGHWPVVCGGQTPQGICNRALDLKYNYSPNQWFTAAAVLLDLLILVITGWYVLAQVMKSQRSRQSRDFVHGNKRLHLLMTAFLHGGAMFILLSCSVVELFFFVQLFSHDSIMDHQEWGFGQIVGITIWTAIIIDLVRHELGE